MSGPANSILLLLVQGLAGNHKCVAMAPKTDH